MKEIKIITHYYNIDTNFGGDYAGVSVYLDNVLVKTYGDYYHDKGTEKSEGFLDGIKYIYPNIKVIKEKIADSNEY